MDLNLEGKHALVCGGSQGIGKASAIELANLGANVTLLARTDETLIEAMNQLPKSQTQMHRYIAVDLNNVDLLRQEVGGLIEFEPIQILVNNTNGPGFGFLMEAKEHEFLDAFKQHVLSNQRLTKWVLSGMQRSGYGRIINIISTSVKQPIYGLGISNTIRAAVANWAKTMAMELGKWGITVNNVLPGATMTRRQLAMLEYKSSQSKKSIDEVKSDIFKQIPLGRFARPQEIGQAVAFLASPAASYITGINLPVDGGRTKSL